MGFGSAEGTSYLNLFEWIFWDSDEKFGMMHRKNIYRWKFHKLLFFPPKKRRVNQCMYDRMTSPSPSQPPMKGVVPTRLPSRPRSIFLIGKCSFLACFGSTLLRVFAPLSNLHPVSEWGCRYIYGFWYADTVVIYTHVRSLTK